MSRFTAQLRHLAARLPIPEPARSRVLLEIATDMEDLLQHHVEKGMERADALQAVGEQFDLSDEALRELVELHSTPLQRSLEGLSGQARSPWERGVLAVVALFVAPSLVMLLLRPDLYRDASAPVFALLPILALAVGVGLWTATALFRRRSRAKGPAPRRGIRALPGLALLMLGIGFAGIWVELYRAALLIRGSTGVAFVTLVGWLHSSAATLVVALSGALLTGLWWFFLEARAAHLDEGASASMMESFE